ncbi:MAG: sigma-70 family RNA polymerase sigma factor [Anaerolineales bacterium]|jgi:RNA polymerase primary sigma factor
MTLIENKLLVNIGDDQVNNIVAHLIERGREQGFISYADILRVMPDVEQDMDNLEKVFGALIKAGIPYIEDGNPSESDESVDTETEDQLQEEKYDLENPETDDLVGLYFYDAARHPLLTHEEEIELAKRIERGYQAREELSQIQSISDQRRSALRKQIDNGWAAVEHLVKANSRLVISVAKKYIGRGVTFLDLIQEGNIGLMRAAKKFEYQRGYKFSTYATWWIRQAITRALADQGRTIRIPVHMGDQISKMQRIQHTFKQDFGRDPSIEEIAKNMHVSPSKIRFMKQVSQFPLSIETPISYENDAVLGDFIEDVESPNPEESASHSLLRQQLEHVFEKLPPREVRILKMRYGLTDGKKYTLRETGEKMGVSRERIRQIERTALKRLRQPKIRHKFRGYFRDGYKKTRRTTNT